MALEAFAKVWEQVMNDAAREIIRSDYVWMHTPPFKAPTPQVKERAEEFADKLLREERAAEYLMATAPKPCPECGRVG